MQNQKLTRHIDDISPTQMLRLINSIALLTDLLEKNHKAKLLMMNNNTYNYYQEICHSFGVRL
jgi:hypothetical protein